MDGVYLYALDEGLTPATSFFFLLQSTEGVEGPWFDSHSVFLI